MPPDPGIEYFSAAHAGIHLAPLDPEEWDPVPNPFPDRVLDPNSIS